MNVFQRDTMNSVPLNGIIASKSALINPEKMLRLFVVSASCIFFVTGLAKIISALFGADRIMALPDPIFGFSFHKLMLFAGSLELFIAGASILYSKQGLGCGLIVWMTTNLVGYRLGLWCIGWHRPCPCLGNLTGALHIPADRADFALRIALWYLLVGGVFSLCWRYWSGPRTFGFVSRRTNQQARSILLVSILALGCCNFGRASEYALSGTLEHNDLDNDGKIVNGNTIGFRLSVKDCDWFIDEQGVVDGGIVVSYDGENCYQYLPGGKDAPRDDPNFAASTGVVRATNAPPQGGVAGIIWLGLASKCYLDDLKQTNSLPAVFLSELRGRTVSYLSSVSREDSEPMLPKEIVFKKDASRPDTLLQSPGFAIYTVNLWTNIGNLKLPLTATVSIYNGKAPDFSKDILPASKFIIRINEVHDHSAVETFAPANIGKYTYIEDCRSNELHLNGSIRYPADHWLTIDEAKATPEYNRVSHLPSVVSKATPASSSRKIVLAILVLSTVIFVGIFFWPKKHST